MQCPQCQSEIIRTTMTRQYRKHAVIRRKKCTSCNHAWYTMETQIPTEAVGPNRTYEGTSTFTLRKDFENLSYQ